MMRVFLTTLAILGGLAAPASAQNNIVPTAPPGTNNNQAASTAFVQQATGGAVSITAFGARCDNGVTDDYPAFVKAFTSLPATLIVPNAACRTSQTINLPPGFNLQGTTFNTQEPPTGSQIVCDLAVSPCVNVMVPHTGSSSLGGQNIQNLTINRAAGTIPAGSICILDQTFKGLFENVNCNGHAIAVRPLATSIYGIVSTFDHLYTCNITDTDLVDDGYAEFRVTNARLGCNGTRATTHNHYVKITGGDSGPNTLFIHGVQFNDINNPACFISWQNLTVSSGTANEYWISHSHFENTGAGATHNQMFCSDNTVSAIQLFKFDHNVVVDNDGTMQAWEGINAATNLGDVELDGNTWLGFSGGWNLQIAGQLLLFRASNETFSNPLVRVTGSGSGAQSLSFTNNSYVGGIEISGSFGSGFPALFTGTMGGGSVTNTATSPVEIDIPGFSKTDSTAALSLSFGGVAATLTSKIASWQLKGSLLTWTFFFQVSAMGSGTGIATLGGLPIGVANGNGLQLAPLYCVSLAGGGPLYASPNGGTSTATINTNGGTGIGNASNANFQVGAVCTGSLSYLIQ